MIERLKRPVGPIDLAALSGLLVAAVAAGEAVSFLAPFDRDQASAWWVKTLAAADPRAIILVARDGGVIVGSVQLHPSWAPNQPFRAEISKLLVHPDFRRRGWATRLMRTIDGEARAAGFRLLTLDAKRDAPAHHLYAQLGWTLVGTIPDFALDPDGVSPHDAVVMYRALG
ncbi:MAG: GNAT family N-acetyltransferase [Planctomycetes bacterium]|nr:GNAT family N-acetyltransferase [Planctomycetota bacterium]